MCGVVEEVQKIECKLRLVTIRQTRLGKRTVVASLYVKSFLQILEELGFDF